MNDKDKFEALVKFAEYFLPTIQSYCEPIYGTFHGGDPRNFIPDPDASSEEERQRHQIACDLWTKWEIGELTDIPESNPDCSTIRGDDGKVMLILTEPQFGLGTNCDSRGQELCHYAQMAIKK